jgi:protein transport protein SEC24
MCNYANDVPPEYFCATTPQGARVDREQRPELMRGTVEFLVPKEYWNKEPVGLRCLFLIDVGQEAYNKGFIAAFCEGIMTALYGGSDESQEASEIKRTVPEGSKVGFVTFDRDIHFYNMSVREFRSILMIFNSDKFFRLHLTKHRC